MNYLLKGVFKMNEEIKKMLDEEIKSEIEDLSSLNPGSEEKSAAIDDLAKLYKLKIEEAKNEIDSTEKKNQLSEDAKNRYFRLGVEAAGIILPIIFYSIWMNKGFKFEETGTFTSQTFRGLFKCFRPTK